MMSASCTQFQSSDGVVFKFWGDNLDKEQHVRDLRSDHQNEMLHMFSLVVGKGRTPAPELSFTSQLSQLTDTSSGYFLPSSTDVAAVKNNLVTLVGRILIEYFPSLACFPKYSGFHLMGPPVKRISRVIGTFCQKRKRIRITCM